MPAPDIVSSARAVIFASLADDTEATLTPRAGSPAPYLCAVIIDRKNRVEGDNEVLRTGLIETIISFLKSEHASIPYIPRAEDTVSSNGSSYVLVGPDNSGHADDGFEYRFRARKIS